MQGRRITYSAAHPTKVPPLKSSHLHPLQPHNALYNRKTRLLRLPSRRYFERRQTRVDAHRMGRVRPRRGIGLEREVEVICGCFLEVSFRLFSKLDCDFERKGSKSIPGTRRSSQLHPSNWKRPPTLPLHGLSIRQIGATDA